MNRILHSQDDYFKALYKLCKRIQSEKELFIDEK